MASLGLNSAASAEDSRLLKLPSFFRRSEQPAVQSPTQRQEQHTATDDRVLNRARQLMSEARKEEAQGRLENAIDLGARADGVYRAAQRTSDARWPANEQSPAEYVRQLEGKLLARASQQTAKAPAAAVSVGVLPGQLRANSQTQPLANATVNALASGSEFGKTQRPDETAAIDATAADQLRNEFLPSPTKALEGLTKQGRNVLDVATTAKGIADVVLGPTDSTSSDSAEPLPDEPAPAEPTKVEKSLQTARTVLDRLDQMQHWQPVSGEKPAIDKSTDPTDPPLPRGEAPGARTADANNPLLIGTPSEIADDQVNPIPTQFQADRHSDDGPAPIEIRHPGDDPIATPGKLHDLPGMPLTSKVPDSSVQANSLLMPAIGGTEPTVESDKNNKGATHPLWVIGTVQALATFIGALGALLVVLGLRPKAKAAAASIAAPATTASVAAIPTAAGEVTEANHDAAHHEPTTIPFRRVDASTERDATKPAVPITHEAAAKSVFEQNLQLLDELNHLAEKKAA